LGAIGIQAAERREVVHGRPLSGILQGRGWLRRPSLRNWLIELWQRCADTRKKSPAPEIRPVRQGPTPGGPDAPDGPPALPGAEPLPGGLRSLPARPLILHPGRVGVRQAILQPFAYGPSPTGHDRSIVVRTTDQRRALRARPEWSLSSRRRSDWGLATRR